MFSIPQSGISLAADSSEVPGFQQPASAMCTSLHTMFLRLSECKNYSASFGNCCSEQLFLFLFLIFFHRSSNVGFPPEGRGCGYNPGNPQRGKGAAKGVAIFGIIFFLIPVLSSVVAARHQISYFCLKLAVIHTPCCPWRTSPSTLANKGSLELPCK